MKIYRDENSLTVITTEPTAWSEPVPGATWQELMGEFRGVVLSEEQVGETVYHAHRECRATYKKITRKLTAGFAFLCHMTKKGGTGLRGRSVGNAHCQPQELYVVGPPDAARIAECWGDITDDRPMPTELAVWLAE